MESAEGDGYTYTTS